MLSFTHLKLYDLGTLNFILRVSLRVFCINLPKILLVKQKYGLQVTFCVYNITKR